MNLFLHWYTSLFPCWNLSKVVCMWEPILFWTRVNTLLTKRTPYLSQLSKIPTEGLTQYPSFRASRITHKTLWTSQVCTVGSRLKESPVASPDWGDGSLPMLMALPWSGGTMWKALKNPAYLGIQSKSFILGVALEATSSRLKNPSHPLGWRDDS